MNLQQMFRISGNDYRLVIRQIINATISESDFETPALGVRIDGYVFNEFLDP